MPLANLFVSQFTNHKARFATGVTGILETYGWPGNVRELRNAIERAVLLSHGEVIFPEHLPMRIQQAVTKAGGPETVPAGTRLEDVERKAILQALREQNFNRTEAAKALGMSRRALLYKLHHLRELGFQVDPLPPQPAADVHPA
jgi:two-component system response regulator AtoC